MAQHKQFGILGLAICALGISLMIPWAFHIGGRFTALFWSGTGMLQTSEGSYPIYVLIYPTMQRANGLDGWGWLCTSHDTSIPLTVDGSFEGGVWRWSLDGASTDLAFYEPQGTRSALTHPIDRGGFDLVGYWRGPELVMRENREHSTPFRSDFDVEHASVTLRWGTKEDFKSACSKAATAPRKGGPGN